MANFNINKVILGGRITKDVELKQTQNGVPVAQLSIAVNRKASKDQTDFINCIAWRNTAEFISKYFKKGSSICVVGSIQTRSWQDQNGNKRFSTEILADEAYFVDSKGEDTTNVQNGSQSNFGGFTATPNFEEMSSDEDLPF